MKKIIAILLILALSLSVSCAAKEAAAPQKQHLFLAGTSAGSGAHMLAIAIANIWNQYLPEVTVTPVEAKAGNEGTVGVEDGVFDMTSSLVIASGPGAALYKEPPFQNRPVYNGWRLMFMRDLPSFQQIFAREDSGIKTVSDLNGRKLSAGIAGGAGERDNITSFRALGIEPKFIPMSAAEAVAALKEGRLEAWIKVGSGYQVDASVLDVLTRTKLRMVGWTQAEADKVVKSGVLPFRTFNLIPAGANKAFPQAGPMLFLGSIGGSGVCTVKGRISQELGYKLVKTALEHWQDLYTVWPASKQIVEEYGDPIKFTIQSGQVTTEHFADKFHEYYPGEKFAPLHPGAVQYFKEKGNDIPESLIPPEYVQ